MRLSQDKKEVAARISFSCGSGGNGQRRNIRITDQKLGLVILNLEMSHEEFGKALAYQSHNSNCTAEIYYSDHYGKEMVMKTEVVNVAFKDYDKRLEELILAVKPHEVDGWIADLYVNSKRHNRKTNTYPVIFRRYV